MFSLLCSKTPNSLYSILRNLCDLRVLECTPVVIARSLSSTISCKQPKGTSFTVSYLVNSCGLSPKDANVVSKRVQFENLDRPDTVLALFNKHGFNNSQIARIVKLWPNVLLADPEKIIANKLDFFCSIGISGTDLAKLVSANPTILGRSLNNRIIPLYKLLKSTLQFGDHTIIKAMSTALRFFVPKEARIEAIIAYLREVGMPESTIQLLAIRYFQFLCLKVDIIKKKINEVIDMGFHPTERMFIEALHAVSSLSASTWQQKIEVYGRCGWSKDELMSAFRKYPQCMTFSEKKIINGMNFFVHVMDLKPSTIAACPYSLTYSLEKRTVPRGLVVKILVSKGVLGIDINFYSVLHKTDERFFKEYVQKYREQIPYLVDVFEGRVSPQELGFQYAC